jgi:GR25 family glycosyltransferase involved in LPS biosynthesis
MVVNKNNDLAPVIFFGYDRPLHTYKALEALKKNTLASKSTLYIYVDGPKVEATQAQIERINEVKIIVQEEKWCGEVFYYFSKTNLGCKSSIISGVTEVINRHGSAIIVEDDIITSEHFLQYMNTCLSFYASYRSVFSIAGHTLPLHQLTKPDDYNYDLFAYPRVFIWGWATWENRWNLIDWEMEKAAKLLNNKNIIEAFSRGGDDLLTILKDQFITGVDNWDIQVNLASFIHNCVSIVPFKSYVNNIGLDGSGVHCGVGQGINHDLSQSISNPKLLDIIYVDKRIINTVSNIYTYHNYSLWQKAVNKACRFLGLKAKFNNKKKVFA